MTDTTQINKPTEPEAPPAIQKIGALRWAKENLFSTPFNSTLTIVLGIAVFFFWLPGLIEWAIIDSVVYPIDNDACRAADGACWAVIGEKHRPMLFGVYPYEEHWRLVIACIAYLVAVVVTLIPRFFTVKIVVPLWIFTLLLMGTMLWGGIFGLPYVDSSQWGGLPLTLILFTGAVVMGMPLAVLLALGRRSNLPAVKAVCVVFIESLRGVPLITILFVAVNIFPLFLPEGLEFSKLLRVMVGMAIFFACYEAEVIRGGLQAIPKGQYEAADSLGLPYWQTTYKIILPQALRICLPGIMNHIIAAFKNTTFVIIIGLYDMLTATTSVLQDPLWLRFTVEAYIFIGLIYFVCCHALSHYSQNLEVRLARGRRY